MSDTCPSEHSVDLDLHVNDGYYTISVQIARWRGYSQRLVHHELNVGNRRGAGKLEIACAENVKDAAGVQHRGERDSGVRGICELHRNCDRLSRPKSDHAGNANIWCPREGARGVYQGYTRRGQPHEQYLQGAADHISAVVRNGDRPGSISSSRVNYEIRNRRGNLGWRNRGRQLNAVDAGDRNPTGTAADIDWAEVLCADATRRSIKGTAHGTLRQA